MASKGIDDRDSLYGSLLPHHLRIGDTQFYVPPTAITVTKRMKNETVNMLRSRGSFIKGSGYFDLVVDLSLFFPDMESINNELRPLLAQVKKCPFLPVQSMHLNDVYDIQAVSVAGITVSTVPGFPQAITANLQLYSFNPFVYIFNENDRTFDDLFNWPLFRWYYRRSLEPSEGRYTYFEPMRQEMTDQFKFKTAFEGDLDAIRRWRVDRDKMIKAWQDDMADKKYVDIEDFDGETLPFDELDEDLFNQNFDEHYKKAIFEYDITMEDWMFDDLHLTDLSISFQNVITSLQIQAHETPTHQYLGSQDTVIVARFRTDDSETLAQFDGMVRRANYLVREYHKEISNGFIQFDHPLANLFGVKFVVVQDVQSTTVEGQPGVFDIQLTLIAFNRAQKKLAETRLMNGDDAVWEIDGWRNSNAKLLIPFFGWASWLKDRPVFRDLAVKGYMDLDVKQKVLYEAKIKKNFTAVEIYPDLELPTYTEVAEAGFQIINNNDGFYVEPDFFLIYDDFVTVGQEAVDHLNSAFKSEARDTIGGTAVVDKASFKPDEKSKDYTAKLQTERAASKKPSVAQEAPEETNETNLTATEFESLIRQKTFQKMKDLTAAVAQQQTPLNPNPQTNVIKQSWAVAFAKSFDEKLRHFYATGYGANTSLGNVYVEKSNVPIMQTAEMKFFADTSFIREAAHIGIMRVSPIMGEPNSLGMNYEYNIETGVAHLQYYFNKVKTSNMISSYVYDAFGLNADKATDTERCYFAAAVCLYLGFETEYGRLYKSNKKLSYALVVQIKKMLTIIGQTKEWDEATIQKKVSELPVPDYKTASLQNATVYAKSDSVHEESDFEDEETTLREMFHDLEKYDRRGRLVRAFPSFFLMFVDEGQYMGTIKMSDRYFGYQAVTDIMYTNSRKVASSTLSLEMSNVYGSLSDGVKAMDLTHHGAWDLVQSLLAPGFAAKEAERSRNRDASFYKSIMLRTGARVHFRMGYGSNPMSMPTLMNGTITELQNNGESVSVVVQDDGIELTNKIKANPDDTTSGFIFSKKEPTEIVDALLRDDQGFFGNLKQAFSNADYAKHSLGIIHFGAPGRPADNLFGELTSRIMNEINMNVYEVTGKLNSEVGFWSRMGDFFGVGDADEPGININLYDKTVWDVLNITAAIGQDHVVAVHPFDFRSTIFSGKPTMPIAFGYHVDEDDNISLYRKTFRQFHVFDSWTNIMDNSITATEQNMYNVAIGTYYNEGKLDTTEPIYVDTNIWPEKLRTVNLDTTLNAQGIRLVQNIPLIGGWLNKPFKWYYDEGVAIKIAASGLKDHVKEMYDGYLTLVGEPAVKPFDQMLINDTWNSITGPAEVREVTQMMNMEFGFITMVKPDAVVVNSDQTQMNFMHSCYSIGTALTMTLVLRGILANPNYKGAFPIMNAAWGLIKRQYKKMTQTFKIDKGIDKLKEMLNVNPKPAAGTNIWEYDEVTGKWREYNPISEETRKKWKASGLLDDIIKTLDNLELSKMEDLFDKADDILSDNRILGYDKINITKIAKMRRITSKLAFTGAKIAGKSLRAGRWAVRGAVSATGVGIIPVLIETLVTEVALAGVAEYLERFLFTRQACMIATLQKDGYEFSAGINGHKGSVITDSPDLIQRIFTGKWQSVFFSFLGADVSKYAANQQATDAFDIPKVQTAGETSTDNLPYDPNVVVANFIQAHRRVVPYDEKFKARYEQEVIEAQEAYLKRVDSLDEENNRDSIYTVDPVAVPGQSGTGYANMDLNTPSGISAEAINKAFSGTPLAGLGQAFVAVETSIPPVRNPKTGQTVQIAGVINGLYLAAHAAWETGWGDSRIFRDKNNMFGYGAYDSSPYESAWTFDSKQHCINFAAQQIKRDYLLPDGKYFGGATLVGMNKKYATDKNWANGIAGIMRKIAMLDPNYKPPISASSADGVTVLGTQGSTKYRVQPAEAKSVLIDLKTQPLTNIRLTLVSESSLIRQASYNALERMGSLYKSRTGETMAITSAYRPGDPNWHGTGYGCDVDTPNAPYISGAYRFPKGSKEKRNLEILIDCAVETGFGGIIHGDVDVIATCKTKYPGTVITQRNDHFNHLHLSYIRG
ncbi:glucosaminidase domain-containing protein (plasmid) [Paenibacillus rhizovicinus]|uniref:Glucosaminidase domain-containing protein n=1 Tax=Paenibacillus rhizovicinus TaxID=2704463 RepID=A0A6C0PAQ0_9BACL|nr:glucosaminidase domain-containing protein [Paenibacillus rhizovicinus]QHW35654.1 glucosaminidase domain-containing protein [Paenibacillus rhizovicinus]